MNNTYNDDILKNIKLNQMFKKIKKDSNKKIKESNVLLSNSMYEEIMISPNAFIENKDIDINHKKTILNDIIYHCSSIEEYEKCSNILKIKNKLI